MKPQSFFRRHAGALLSFTLPVLFFLFLSLRDGILAELGPDAMLYLSIADNVLSTGHFIQTARDTVDFVVPFGFPLILTVLRALRLSTDVIVALQHLLVGGACLLVYLAEKNRFGRGGFAPAVYCAALLRAHLTPDNLYLEIYYLFFLCLILWLLSREELPLEKKLVWLNIAAFCSFTIRTVLLLVWVPIAAYTLICVVKKRFPLRRAVVLSVCVAVVLGANAAVNHRETGNWILTDNYSGESLYIANNPHTIPAFYSSRELDRFVGEEYYAILNDPSLDQTEENTVFTAAARRWVGENPGTFLKNTAKKLSLLFFRFWLFTPAAALAGCLVSLGRSGAARRRMLWELAVNIALAIATSCALIMDRYSLPIWPLASLHLAALAHWLWDLVGKGGKEKRHAF